MRAKKCAQMAVAEVNLGKRFDRVGMGWMVGCGVGAGA